MPSSLFTQRSNPLSQIAQLKKTIDSIKSGNADALAQQMARSNPAFAQFVSRNRGKSAQQILRQSGIDVDQFNSIVSMLK